MHTSFAHLLESARESFCRGTLYVVATPIGNLADISARALAAFSAADVVCAEDTRVTGQLLSAYGIHAKRLVSLREHNERGMAEQVVRWLSEDQIVVQVSDAGTPAVSDPGARLAEAVRAAGLPVRPVPGSSAVIAALSASGLTAQSFLFHGFLPPKSGERRKTLRQWQSAQHLTVCYEAPHRIVDALRDIVAELGAERRVLLARELTKTFETFRNLPAQEMLEWVESDSNQQRGEIVLILDAAPARDETDDAVPEETVRVLKLLAAELPTKQAASLAAQICDGNRKQLYDLALKLKQD
ncbi:16S rRNA (cytidine(1402)-2'-O)-methyltransferase [Chromobacterium haemolyticum]|uniref:16S rRNA (cytidine(1402)-2'-O)-methyltransferase n=1 Tax=Chromobacterium haemolyticum TaxID=394935 RepID=UPI001AD80C4D